MVEPLELAKNVAKKVYGLVNIVIHLDVNQIHNQFPHKTITFESIDIKMIDLSSYIF